MNLGWSDYHWALTFTSGFLLVAPILATFFYAISRVRERGEPLVDLIQPFRLLFANGWMMGLIVITWAMLASLWARITAIIVAMTSRTDGFAYQKGVFPHREGSFSFASNLLNNPNHLPVVIAFFGVGALFAVVAFTQNPMAMAIWALVTVLLVAIGYLTALIGLIVLPRMTNAIDDDQRVCAAEHTPSVRFVIKTLPA